MQYLNREDVRKVLDRAGFDPDHVIRENYSPHPHAESCVALGINRSAIGRVAQTADDMADELSTPLPTGHMSAVMEIDQTPEEYDLIYFPGFRIDDRQAAKDEDRLGQWIEANVSAEYRDTAHEIPRGLTAEEVRGWLRENGYDSPLALDLVRRAEEAGVLGNADAASGTSAVEPEGGEPASADEDGGEDDVEPEGDGDVEDPFAGLPPSLADMLRKAGAKRVTEEELPQEMRDLMASIEGGLSESVGALIERLTDQSKVCTCGKDHFPDLTDKEQKLLALGYGYRSVGQVRGKTELVEIGDQILEVFGL